MAEMLDAIHQAKRHIVNVREQEKKALKNISAAQDLKRNRKKGGAGERYLKYMNNNLDLRRSTTRRNEEG
jgi:hypothetical protein